MFKIGDRVWVRALKRYFKMTRIDKDIHQTAQTMFEALGYEKDNDVPSGFISYAKISKNGDKYYVMFRLDEKRFVIGLMKPKVPNAFICWVSPQLHQAIHQQMIELGWL